MARIKIKDLPKGMKINRNEMRKVFGGVGQMASQDFSIVTQSDQSSPSLYQACGSGSNSPDVSLHFSGAGGDSDSGTYSISSSSPVLKR